MRSAPHILTHVFRVSPPPPPLSIINFKIIDRTLSLMSINVNKLDFKTNFRVSKVFSTLQMATGSLLKQLSNRTQRRLFPKLSQSSQEP